jgi:uncharacterized protein (TIGR03790 family)
MIRLLFGAVIFCWTAQAQGPQNVLVVLNRASEASSRIAAYYAQRRGIPPKNVCRIKASTDEEISREEYLQRIERPVSKCLKDDALGEQVLYIVTTLGVPLRIAGEGSETNTTVAAVDSELAVLYQKLRGSTPALAGPLLNPYFASVNRPFQHPDVPLYFVTRLAGFDFDDVKGLIDRSVDVRDRGKVVIDVRADNSLPGNQWLRAAAAKIPRERLILDDSARVLYDLTDVIAYASWGFNDPDRHRRTLGFRWLPGAIMTEFVSTNARTFDRPPANWTLGTWKDQNSWFAGAPQDLCADEIHAGVTGASGHVWEPYLSYTPRPDVLLPAYLSGRNLADSYYASIPAVSRQNVVVGDPLCRLARN